jgi:hypothetical protein
MSMNQPTASMDKTAIKIINAVICLNDCCEYQLFKNVGASLLGLSNGKLDTGATGRRLLRLGEGKGGASASSIEFCLCIASNESIFFY